MSESLHPVATHHLPSFITAPGETDWLMVIMAVILAVSVLMFGILFLRLHTLPERMAHRGHKLQFEIVAVLGLIALFTHQHIFWLIGLMLAMIDLPDFGTPLNRIAGSAEKMAGLKPGEGFMEVEELPQTEAPATAHADEPVHEPVREPAHEAKAAPRPSEGPVPLPARAESTPPKRRERAHA
jgi:multisubunit Na+/H+ antiporter MnhF subunit